MATLQVSRLSLLVNDTEGHIHEIRTRPGGFTLPVFEPEHQPLSATLEISRPVGSIRAPQGTMSPAELLEVHTRWVTKEQVELTRTFRTLQRALVERIEVFEFHFRIVPKQERAALRLLQFRSPQSYSLSDNEPQLPTPLRVYTDRYFLTAGLQIKGEGRCLLEPLPDLNDAVLSAQVLGECEILLCFLVRSEEGTIRDPQTYALPLPLDDLSFIFAALAPPMRSLPLSKEPRTELLLPCPTICYAGASVGSFQHPRRALLDRLLRRTKGGVAIPLVNYPYLDLFRMSEVLVYRWRPDLKVGCTPEARH